MADVRRVSDAFAVSPQIRPEEVATLGERFATIINNRPDGEDPDQPTHAQLEAAAKAAGVGYEHIPIAGPPTADQVRAMREALSYSTGPALAFCRGGSRSITVWALGEAMAGEPVEQLQAQAQAAGYDLGPALVSLLPRLRMQSGGG